MDKKSPVSDRFKKLYQKWQKLPLLRLFLKYAGLAVCAVLLSGLIVYATLLYFVDGPFVREKLQTALQTHLGVKVSIETLDFNLNYGLTAKDIRLYPPETVPQGAALSFQEDPLLTLDELNFHYQIPALLAGRFDLSALKLIRPVIFIVRQGESFNFSGIQEFLKRKSAKKKPVVRPEKDEEKSSHDLLPFHPRHLYLPFAVTLKNIGIEGLKLDYRHFTGKKLKQAVLLDGLSFNSSVDISGRSSEIGWALTSGRDGGTRVRLQKENSEELADISLALTFEGLLTDWTKLSIKLRQEFLSWKGMFQELRALGTDLNFSGHLRDDLKGFNIDGFRFEMGKFFNFNLSGEVFGVSKGFSKIQLDLNSSLMLSPGDGIRLAEESLKKILKDKASGIQGSGYIEMEQLRVRGTLDLEKLKSPTPEVIASAELPGVQARVNMNQLTLAAPGLGVSLKPLDGSLAVSVGPSLKGKGYQADLYHNLFMEQLSVRQNSGDSVFEAGLEKLDVQLLAKADWPSKELPVLKLSVDSPHITAKVNGQQTLDLPLSLRQQVSLDAELKRPEINLRLTSGELMSLTVNGGCENKCRKLNATSYLNVNSLEKVHQIAVPFAELVGQAGALPTRMSGRISLQSDVKGSLPGTAKLTPDLIFREGSLNYSTQFTLAQVSLDHPERRLSVKDLDVNFSLDGDLHAQKIRLDHRIGMLSLQLPARSGQTPPKAELSRFSFSTWIENSIKGEFPVKPDPAAILGLMKTNLRTEVFWNQLAVAPLLPAPVTDFSLKIAGLLEEGRYVNLDQLLVRVPGLGLSLETSGKVRSGVSFLKKALPESFSTRMAIQVNHSGKEAVPVPVQTSGRFQLALAAESQDMRNIEVQGKAGFRHFNVKVLGKAREEGAASPSPLLLVENMNGEIPFRRRLNVKKISELAGKKGSGPVASGSASRRKVPALHETIDQFLLKSRDPLASRTNAMSMANYGSVRPFYPGRHPVYIKKAEAANLTLHDIEFDVELSQNWFSLNQFMMGFLGGKIQGTFQFGFDELTPHSVKTALHLTRLNTHRLLDRFPQLKRETESGLLDADPWLDASVHLNYNIREQDISGGIDITSIGKEQLKMILFFVDPEEKDPAIDKIKLALSFGEVDQVKIPVKNGEVDVDVGVNFLVGIPFPVPKITRIPLTTLLGNVLQKKKPEKSKKPVKAGEGV